MEGSKTVSVAVRVRPILRDAVSSSHQQEKFELEAIQRTGDTSLKVELCRPGEPTRSSMFTFDHIFDQESTQLEVYEDAVVDLVDGALTGVNATILAYGQTGSGKTFTVLGDVKPNPLENDLLTHDSGMFLRVLNELIEYQARQAKKGFHVVVGLSCVEIYNDNIRDLFGGSPGTEPPALKAMMIGDDVFLPSLIIKEMTTIQDVFNEIQLAISRRKSRSTEVNATSSRSHCLFFIDILQQAATAPRPSLSILDSKKGGSDGNAANSRRGAAPPVSPTSKSTTTNTINGGAELKPWELPFNGTVFRVPGQQEPIYASKILLADLAGSEKIQKSGVSGDGLAEATAINSSLTALGNVVHSLYEGGYVSYRTSNLTRLLKPTFSHPSSRVLLLTQVSPTQLTFEETISSLHFANKVKAMKVTTTTGMEAEQIQFEFVETQKTYDTLLSDLRIFSVDSMSKPALLRRHKFVMHDGLFYDPTAKAKVKPNPKERRAALESNGAVNAAGAEKKAIGDKRVQEEAEMEKRIDADVRVKTQQAIREHEEQVKETKDQLQKERHAVAHSAHQRLNLESAAGRNQIQTEEELDFAVIRNRCAGERNELRKKLIVGGSKRLEELNKESIARKTMGDADFVPEIADDNSKYALSTWHHCTAQRFFSRCMELREMQAALYHAQVGVAKLAKWKEDNKELLQAESSA